MAKKKEDRCYSCKRGEPCPLPVSCPPKDGGSWSWPSHTNNVKTANRSSSPTLKPKFDWKEGEQFSFDHGHGKNRIYVVTNVGVRGVYAKNEHVSSMHFSWNDLLTLAKKIA